LILLRLTRSGRTGAYAVALTDASTGDGSLVVAEEIS
jgi:hypothetical protein